MRTFEIESYNSLSEFLDSGSYENFINVVCFIKQRSILFGRDRQKRNTPTHPLPQLCVHAVGSVLV